MIKTGLNPILLFKLTGWVNKHSRAFADGAEVWNKRGFHGTEQLRKWLDGHLGELTFEQAEGLGHVQSLRIVASRVSARKFRVFGQTKADGGLRVALAVQASISIPVFFVPLTEDQDVFVDGGMLSNFPSFLFARSEYLTVGFRLNDLTPPKRIASTIDFLRSLLHTMTEAHDQLRGLPDYFKSYDVEVPEDIPATKFNLNTADIDRLYQRGLNTGRAVEWDRYSSPGKIIPYWDPKPSQGESDVSCMRMPGSGERATQLLLRRERKEEALRIALQYVCGCYAQRRTDRLI